MSSPAKIAPAEFKANEISILLALTISSAFRSSSPKTVEIASLMLENAAWIRRHGKRLNNTYVILSPNGHCFPMTAEAHKISSEILANYIPREDPKFPSAYKLAGRHPRANLALLSNGDVLAWCPPSLVDNYKAGERIPAPPLSDSPKKKPQHDGMWLRVTRPHMGYGSPNTGYANGKQPSSGDVVRVISKTSIRGLGTTPLRQTTGIVIAAAMGMALVDWGHERDPQALRMSAIETASLLLAADQDTSLLTDWQLKVHQAITDGSAIVEPRQTGKKLIVDGKAVSPGTLEGLHHSGLLPDPLREALL